jgi:hypothetical protein
MLQQGILFEKLSLLMKCVAPAPSPVGFAVVEERLFKAA